MDRAQNRNKSPYRPRHQAEPEPRGPLASLSSSAKKNVAAAAVSAALLGAFGVGAFTVAQGDASFDPQAFVSNLGGDSGSDTGYRANPTDADADANRHKDDSKDDKQSADASQGNRQDDAFSNADQQAGGAAAYNVTGSGTGASVNVANGGLQANGGTGDGATTPGLVVEPGANGTGGNEQGGSNDQPNGGGNGGSNTGENNGGNGGSGDTPTPTPSFDPTENSYKVLPQDPTPKKDPGYAMDGAYRGESTLNPSTSPEYDVTISYDKSASDSPLYVGQRIDEWSIFCSLSTFFTYTDANGNRKMYSWYSTQDQFSSYPYFRIDDWWYDSDDVTIHKPSIVPSEGLTVKVSYRYTTDGAWNEATVEIAPEKSCVFVVGEEREDGADRLVTRIDTNPANLLAPTLLTDYFTDAGYLRDDGTLSRLLLGWTEGGEGVDWLYPITPGRHVVESGETAEVPDGYTAKLHLYNLTDDYRVTSDTQKRSAYLQTLSDVSDSVVEDGALKVPEGIQSVDSTESEARTGLSSVDTLELPASTIYVSQESLVNVAQAYRVDEGNPYLTSTEDGLLLSKDGTACLGVPTQMTSLDVPATVADVELPKANSIEELRVHAAADSLPTINIEDLGECNIIVDDNAFVPFVQENIGAIQDTWGVSVSPASNPDARLTVAGGMILSDDEVVGVLDVGLDTAFVQMQHTVKAGSFKGNTQVTTVAIGDGFDDPYTLEDGCFEGGNVQRIVCFSTQIADYVRGRLTATGAPDAQVIVASDSQEDCLYYECDDEIVLLSYQGLDMRTFDGTLTTSDGEKIEVTTIAPNAFYGDPYLEWVVLGDSTTKIGAEAFRFCTGLKGVYMGTESPIEVGKNAFADCSSLDFWVSRSLNASFESQENPNPSCNWLCRAIYDAEQDKYFFPEGYDPINADGRFNCIGGVTDFMQEAQADGMPVVYAPDDDGQPWIAMASGGSYTGELVIPSTVVEIFDGAFSNLQGAYTLSWAPSADTAWIDSEAFRGSGLAGDISVGTSDKSLVIGDRAFMDCPGIDSFTATAYKLTIGDHVFSSCDSLTSLTLSNMIGGSLGTEPLNGSDACADIYFTGQTPPTLTLMSQGLGHRFNYSWEPDEEAQKLHLHVPEGSEQAFIEQWVYPLVGYPNYNEYFAAVQYEILSETWEMPSETEVRERMAENLLEPENRLRQEMGLEPVDASTIIKKNVIEDSDGNKFTVSDDGSLTLTSVTPWAGFDSEEFGTMDLSSIVPEGYDSVSIAEDAFKDCVCLYKLVLGDKVAGIAKGAFEGTQELVVVLPKGHVPTLIGGSAYDGFSFGGEGLKLVAEGDDAEATQQAYLEAWPRQCVGATSDQLLQNYASDIYWGLIWNYEPGSDELEEAFDSGVNEPFRTHENYLRGLMGLDEIDSIDQLAYRYDVSSFDPWA